MSESDIRRILEGLAEVKAEVRGIRSDNERGEEVHKDHETRLRALERVRWLIAGAGMVLGGGAATVAQKILAG